MPEDERSKDAGNKENPIAKWIRTVVQKVRSPMSGGEPVGEVIERSDNHIDIAAQIQKKKEELIEKGYQVWEFSRSFTMGRSPKESDQADLSEPDLVVSDTFFSRGNKILIAKQATGWFVYNNGTTKLIFQRHNKPKSYKLGVGSSIDIQSGDKLGGSPAVTPPERVLFYPIGDTMIVKVKGDSRMNDES